MRKTNSKIQNNQTADKIQLLRLKHRAELVGLENKTLAGIHKRSVRTIELLFAGERKLLLPKVISTIERYEIKSLTKNN